MKLKNLKIGFIGAGNLVENMIHGLLASQRVQAKNLFASRKNLEKLTNLQQKTGINISLNNNDIVKQTDLLIFGVKPFQIFDVIKDLQTKIKDKQIIISLTNGVSAKEIAELLPNNAVYNAIANTAMLVQQSMTCINATNNNETNDNLINELFSLVGELEFLDENQMKIATVIASCNIAYLMRYIRANILAGINIGMKPNLAKKLSAQTMKGAAEIIIKNKSNPEDEIDKVCTPGGITIKGLTELEKQGFSNSIIQAFSKLK